MADEPANLPEPARCLLRALWTWCYDPPKRLDDATADVAAEGVNRSRRRCDPFPAARPRPPDTGNRQ